MLVRAGHTRVLLSQRARPPRRTPPCASAPAARAGVTFRSQLVTYGGLGYEAVHAWFLPALSSLGVRVGPQVASGTHMPALTLPLRRRDAGAS